MPAVASSEPPAQKEKKRGRAQMSLPPSQGKISRYTATPRLAGWFLYAPCTCPTSICTFIPNLKYTSNVSPSCLDSLLHLDKVSPIRKMDREILMNIPTSLKLGNITLLQLKLNDCPSNT